MKRVAVFNDTSVERHYGCDAVMSSLVSGLKRQRIKASYLWPVGTDWQPYCSALAANKVDAIVVNGEGTIHNSAKRSRAKTLAKLSHFAHQTLNVPAFLINATLHNLDPETLHNIAAFDIIFVRESRSREYLAGHGIASHVVPDLSLACRKVNDPGPVRNGLMVTDSVDRAVAEKLRVFAEGKGRYRSMIAPFSVAQRITNKFFRTIQYTPSPRRRHLKLHAGYGEFIETLRRSNFVLTGRFHTVTLCVLTRTPFVAIESNTPKIDAFLLDVFGNNERLLLADQLDSDTLLEAMRPRSDFSAEELRAVVDYTERATHDISKMFEEIRANVP